MKCGSLSDIRRFQKILIIESIGTVLQNSQKFWNTNAEEITGWDPLGECSSLTPHRKHSSVAFCHQFLLLVLVSKKCHVEINPREGFSGPHVFFKKKHFMTFIVCVWVWVHMTHHTCACVYVCAYACVCTHACVKARFHSQANLELILLQRLAITHDLSPCTS